MEIKQKWINEHGVFYPIPGNTTLHITPGTGVFQIHEDRSMSGSRLGLVKLADSFQFNFKIYDLGIEDIMQKIEKTWNSDVFVNGDKNLGVIFNGLKGTGKTIGAKILSNRMGIPVILVNAPYNGLLDFIQSLCFECVVLIDEAEDVIKAVDTLEISTIDILKAIVDEVNIHGEISEHSMLNVPKARYKIDIIKFDDLKREDFDDFKQFMKDHVPADESLRSWLDKPWRVNEENKQEDNQDMIEDKFDMNCWITQIASSSPVIIKGQHSQIGEVIEEVDGNGYFVVQDNYSDDEVLCRILNYHDAPSLYRGSLKSLFF